MCDPALGIAALTAVTTATKNHQEAAATTAQNEATLTTYNQNIVQSQRQQSEEQAAKDQASLDNKRETLQATADAQVQASSVGAAGNSLDAMFNDLIMYGAEQEANLTKNLQYGTAQRAAQDQHNYRNAQNMMIDFQRTPTLLNAASAGLMAYVPSTGNGDGTNKDKDLYPEK